jgi:hypothetical protein
MNLEKLAVHYITSKVLMGVQHVKKVALKIEGAGIKSSEMRCHITCSPITVMYTFNTLFYQIHTDCAVCSPITFMYTLQYTVLSNSHTLCCM